LNHIGDRARNERFSFNQKIKLGRACNRKKANDRAGVYSEPHDVFLSEN
jgi:hypothetical protein